MRPPPKLESGPNAGIRANPVRLKKYSNCIVIPSVRGVARIPAFGPLSNFGGGRIYIVAKEFCCLFNEEIPRYSTPPVFPPSHCKDLISFLKEVDRELRGDPSQIPRRHSAWKWQKVSPSLTQFWRLICNSKNLILQDPTYITICLQ